MTEQARRIAFVVNPLADGDLRAGKTDVSHVYSLLLQRDVGGCDHKKTPVPLYDCSNLLVLMEELNKLLENWEGRDQLIFYFSGHGEYRRGDYCLRFGPANTDLLPFTVFSKTLSSLGVSRAIIIIDACYSGDATKSQELPLEILDLPKGMAVLASSGRRQQSMELRDGTGSVFTTLFCEAVKSGLGGRETRGGKIFACDIVEYVNQKLDKRTEYEDYSQRARYRVNDADRGIWIALNRSGGEGRSENVVAPERAIYSYDELQSWQENTNSEHLPCGGAGIDELDRDLLREYANRLGLRLAENFDAARLAERLGLFSSFPPGNKETLHKPAVLCFCRSPEKFLPRVKSIFVSDYTGGKTQRSEHLLGPLRRQFDDLFKMTRQALEVAPLSVIQEEDGLRREREDLSVSLIRELISNAIVHRDYESKGCVELRIGPEWVEVRSPGGFPKDVTWQTLLEQDQFKSLPVNETIVLYLYRLGMFEQAGRGFDLIRRYLSERGPESITCEELAGFLLFRISRASMFSKQDSRQRAPSVDREVSEIGRIVSHFKIQERIGAGGMAEVYKALDLDLARPVALKFLTRTSGRDGEDLLKEARAVSKLDHRNICSIYEISETDEGTQFIAMAFYQGETLAQMVKRSQLPVLRAIEITSQVADGLYAAHRHEIIHRDVKPSNIMVTGEGDVKILDFGIARLIRDDAEHQKAFGTLTYMAPERVKEAEGDERSDIWSLGVVFYTMVAGRPPFRAESSDQLAAAILHSEPAPISGCRPAEIGAIKGILEKALAKDPADRYRTAQELRKDLQRARGELAGAIDPVPTHPVRIAGSDHDKPDQGEKSSEVSLAILPLKDLSPEQDQEYFCSGMAEELIFLLTKVPGLRVAARESALRLLGDTETSSGVGRRLGVANVLEGSIGLSGNRLRVTARLVRVADDRYLWSGKYDREIEDLFHIQDEIAREITEALEITLIRDLRELDAVATDERLKAHDLYLKGRYYWNRRGAESLKRAIGYFERAIAELPSYARAYAGLADSHAMLGVYGALPPSEVMPKARKAANQALALDDALAEVYVSRALVRAHYEWDFGRAETDFKKALELNPHHATAHEQYAMTCLLPMARFEEAFEELRLAQNLDPLSVPICVSLGFCYYCSGQYAKAAEGYRNALDIDRTFIRVRMFLAEAYEQQGDLDDALVVVLRAEELSARGPTVLSALGRVYSRSGFRDRAGRILNQLLKVATQRYVAPTLIAQLYVGLEEKKLALAALQRAYDLRSAELIWLGVHPLYEPLRTEPGFRRLLEKLGLDRG